MQRAALGLGPAGARRRPNLCCPPPPVSPQGPTSAGKTSLVSYLAAQTGHTFGRINNHEQTDLQVRAAENLRPCRLLLLLLLLEMLSSRRANHVHRRLGWCRSTWAAM